MSEDPADDAELDVDETPDDEPADDVEPLLGFLRDRRGFDFTGYKRPSLTRRIRRRMNALGLATYADYVRLLESQPGEFGQLFDSILINVTSFRRDADAWDGLAGDTLPTIIERADAAGTEIRIWSAGCASGEEAYTLAVLMADLVGEERFRTAVMIYATDVDEEALRARRMGRYPYRQLVEAFGEERTKKYFEPADSAYAFRPNLRRSVIFGRHDLVQDPPISRIDLITCRNTLMYFNAEIQHRILASFHFALVPDGYLFLGKAEAFATRMNLFSTVDLKRHIFLKKGDRGRARPPLPAPMTRHGVGVASTDHRALVESAFEGGPSAQLAVDRDGVLVAANRLARALFNLGASHVGRPLRDLEVSYRPIELRSIIDEVLARRRPVTIAHVAPPAGPRVHRDLGGIGTAGRGRRHHPRHHRHLRRRQPLQGAPGRAGGIPSRAGGRPRRASVGDGGAGNDQRGAPVHERGAGDHQRGAPLHERRARDDERGAPVHERRAGLGER